MWAETTINRLRLYSAFALFLGLFAWIFFDVLFCGRMFAFRDAGHFYYPLFEYIQSQWSAGQVPLFNPLENDGSPLLANAACSVFYPLKIIFCLPISFAWAYRVYILIHVALAGFWSYRLARYLGTSIEASALAAISYAFCGNVLMQHTNVIFLVGATWLPAAMIATGHMLVERRLRHAVAFGATLAMMTLGGDAQMAYNAALLAVLYAFCFNPAPLAASPCRPKNRVTLLALAAISAFLLAAVQIIPAAQFTKSSDRAFTETSRSIYEIPQALKSETPDKNIADGLLCRRLDPATHHGRVYQFSVGPWRLAEYVWPNFSGRQYPVNGRWLEAVPAEGRVWTPTLYMGILPLVLGVAAMRFRRRKGTSFERWLSWSAVLSVVASFGCYGVGWLVQELQLATGIGAASDPFIGSPVGGLYWMMSVVLPGYIYFRYPAKLLVITSIALSTLAARGFDSVFSDEPPAGFAIRRPLAWLCSLSLLLAAVSLAVRPWRNSLLSATPPDVLFGPLDTAAAFDSLLFSFLQTGLICGLVYYLLRRFGPNRRTAFAVLAITAIDLGLANAWIVATAPADIWLQPSKIAQAIRRDRSAHGESGTPRVWRHPVWMPAAWKLQGSPERIAESVRWDRDTLWPKHNLPEGIAIVEVHGTMMSHEYAARLAGAGWPELMDVTNADYAILPENEELPGGRRVECAVPGVSLWRYER